MRIPSEIQIQSDLATLLELLLACILFFLSITLMTLFPCIDHCHDLDDLDTAAWEIACLLAARLVRSFKSEARTVGRPCWLAARTVPSA